MNIDDSNDQNQNSFSSNQASLDSVKGDILVVDDQPNNLHLLFTSLSAEGYEVRRVLSGKQALKVAAVEPPDLILLDIKMPEIDGYEVCLHLKADSRTASIPVIFLSALDEAIDKVKAFEVGGADYISKPFQLAEVIARIEHQLNLLRLQQKVKQQNQLLQQRTQQLEFANQELQAFNYSVSHDLQAPLRAIQGITCAFIEDYGDLLDETAHDYLNRVVGSAEQLDILIKDLLAYSHLGRTNIHFQPVYLDMIVDNVVKEVEPLRQQAQAKIVVESPFPVVRANRTILMQVMLNLVTNALKFVTGEEPLVTIRSEKRQDWLRLWVEDNGIGVAPEHQQRIFKVFERLHGIEAYPGTGIGLAIVQRGIKRLGGRVGVNSKVAQGSQFWLDLPLSDTTDSSMND